jgi:hypothetical protein
MQGRRYDPAPAPRSEHIQELLRWVTSELRRIAGAVAAPDVDTLSFGKETLSTATGSTLVVNWKKGQAQRVFYSGTVEILFEPPWGVSELVLVVERTGTGGALSLDDTTVCWAGGTPPTFSTASGSVDVVRIYYDGASYHAHPTIGSAL